MARHIRRRRRALDDVCISTISELHNLNTYDNKIGALERKITRPQTTTSNAAYLNMPRPSKPNLTLDSSFLFDAIIVGAGPAGLSAALAMARAQPMSVVFSNDKFRNAKGRHAQYLLSRDHQPAPEVRRISREEIQRYGTSLFTDQAVKAASKNVETGLFEAGDATGENGALRKSFSPPAPATSSTPASPATRTAGARRSTSASSATVSK